MDDEPSNVQLMGTLLSEHGYDVLPALGGNQALERSAVRKPDLAIFDLNMPGMDGIELCRRFRETPALAAVPVIFVTGAVRRNRCLVRCFEGGSEWIFCTSRSVPLSCCIACVLPSGAEVLSRPHGAEITKSDVLTAMVAHDLKSPLASIRFSVEMLAEDPVMATPRMQELLASLIESTNHTLAFIDDFLNRKCVGKYRSSGSVPAICLERTA